MEKEETIFPSKMFSYWMVICFACCHSIIFLNASMIPIALPSLQATLGFSSFYSQWIYNVFLLISGSFVIIGGKIGDAFGHKKVFFYGNFLFVLGILLTISYPVALMLLVGRIIQGFAAALMIPSSMTLLVKYVPFSKQGRMIGAVISIATFISVLGPIIGGYLAKYASWQVIFLVFLPFSLLNLLLIPKIFPNEQCSERHLKIAEFFLPFCAVFFLMIFFMQTKIYGWGAKPLLSLLVISISCFLLSVWKIKHKKQSFVDTAIFKNRFFMQGSMIMFMTQFILALLVFWPIFFQKTFGYSSIETGQLFLLTVLPVLIFAPLSGVLSDHYGPNLPITVGFILMILSLILITYYIHFSKTALSYMVPLALFGTGSSFIINPVGIFSIASLRGKHQGQGTGIYNTFRFLGSASGVAIIGSLLTNLRLYKFTKLLAMHSSTSSLNPGEYLFTLNPFLDPSNPFFSLSNEMQQAVKQALVEASIFSYQVVNILCGFIAFIGIVISSLLFKTKEQIFLSRE